MPENKEAVSSLKEKLASLSLSIPKVLDSSPAEKSINDKNYSLQDNDRDIEKISFDFKDGSCLVKMKSDTINYIFSFGNSKWNYGMTDYHVPNLLQYFNNHDPGIPTSKVAGSYTWLDDNTLQLTLRFIESPHTDTWTCRFDGDDINIDMGVSFDVSRVIKLKGTTTQAEQI